MSSGHPRTCPVGQHKAGHLWAGPLPGSQHILAQTSVYAAASFRARCLLPRGAEPALSGCASQQVWLLLGGPTAGDNGRSGLREPPPVTWHLGRQLNIREVNRNPSGATGVKGTGAKLETLDRRQGSHQKLFIQESHRVSDAPGPGLWDPEPPGEGGMPKPLQLTCESRAVRGQGQAQGTAPPPPPGAQEEKRGCLKGSKPFGSSGRALPREINVRDGEFGTTCQTNELHQLITAK
uniref:Uncharacterized protein n=1 Tax=uncultured bacterium TB157_p TaxID=1552133 RepID=A0A0K0LBF8_9BACT|nr:hypothetical protein [uncultured bacterium TB157_p]